MFLFIVLMILVKQHEHHLSDASIISKIIKNGLLPQHF